MNSKIGERIKECRLKRGLTLKQMAEKIGVSEATFSRYESGHIEKLSISMIEQIAEELNESPMYIAGFTTRKDEEERHTLSTRLFKLRDEMKLNFDELAESINNLSLKSSQEDGSPTYKVTKEELERCEQTGYMTSVELLKTLADFYGVSMNYILGRSNSRTDMQIHTIAAHATSDLTDEEQLKLLEYAKFIKSQRPQ